MNNEELKSYLLKLRDKFCEINNYNEYFEETNDEIEEGQQYESTFSDIINIYNVNDKIIVIVEYTNVYIPSCRSEDYRCKAEKAIEFRAEDFIEMQSYSLEDQLCDFKDYFLFDTICAGEVLY